MENQMDRIEALLLELRKDVRPLVDERIKKALRRQEVLERARRGASEAKARRAAPVRERRVAEILAQLTRHPEGMGKRRLADRVRGNATAVRALIEELTAQGVLIKTGEKTKTRYRLAEVDNPAKG